MSSDAQADSPEQQRARLSKLAKDRGYSITEWFTDSGISGLSVKRRPEFRRLLAEAERGAFDVVIAWDLDRLSRADSLEAGEWAGRFQRAGVRLETVVQGAVDLDSFAGRVQFALGAELANEYVRKLSQASSRGRLERAKRGVLMPRAVYGYDRVYHDEHGIERERVPFGQKFDRPKSWSIRLSAAKDGSAEVVREMFRRFTCEDTSMCAIAADLNTRGVPSPKGARWVESRIRYILTNPTYGGTRTYGRFSRGKLTRVASDGNLRVPGRQEKPVYTAVAPCVEIEGGHEPIVDRETFDAAQNKFAALKAAKRKPRANSPYLLTGLVRCGVSGVRVFGYKCCARGKSYRYYRTVPDGWRKRDGIRTISADALESFVLDLLREAVLAEGKIEQLRSRIREAAGRRLSTGDKRSRDASKRLAALDAKVRTATERMLTIDVELLDDARRVLDDLRAERDRLRVESEAGGDVPALGVEAVTQKAVGMIYDLRARLDSGNAPAMRSVVQSFVSRIDLFWADPKEWRGQRRAEFSHGIVELCALPTDIVLFPRTTAGSNSRTTER